jgi:GGDEF domain-containing protein
MRILEAGLFAQGEAFRLGGDEYLAIVPNATAQRCASLIHGIQDRLKRVDVLSPPGPVTCSVGIVEVSTDCYYGDFEIQTAANWAKNAAKAGGKDCIAGFATPEWRPDWAKVIRLGQDAA